MELFLFLRYVHIQEMTDFVVLNISAEVVSWHYIKQVDI